MMDFKQLQVFQELRRGNEVIELCYLSFDYSSKYIACSSNKDIVQVFNAIEVMIDNKMKNQKSIIGREVPFSVFQMTY